MSAGTEEKVATRELQLALISHLNSTLAEQVKQQSSTARLTVSIPPAGYALRHQSPTPPYHQLKRQRHDSALDSPISSTGSSVDVDSLSPLSEQRDTPSASKSSVWRPW